MDMWKDRKTSEELRKLVGVEPITTFIRSGRLRWYGHVMRKGDKDWVKNCMEYRVEGRRSVGRPRKTWLESVEADMAEHGIDLSMAVKLLKRQTIRGAKSKARIVHTGIPQGSKLSPMLFSFI